MRHFGPLLIETAEMINEYPAPKTPTTANIVEVNIWKRRRETARFLRCPEITHSTPNWPVVEHGEYGEVTGYAASFYWKWGLWGLLEWILVSHVPFSSPIPIFFTYSLVTQVLVMVWYLWTRIFNLVKNRLSFTGLIWKTSLLQNQRILEWEVIFSSVVQSSHWG